MANTVRFRGQPIADGIVTMVPSDRPIVQVTRQTGLFFDEVGLACDSRNMECGLVFELHLKRDSQLALVEAVAAIQSLQGLQGLLEVFENDLLRMRADDWWMDSIDEPRPTAGYGGRWLPSLVVRFVGESAAVWY